MTAAVIAALTATMLATSVLSGVFGMAGGMILMGILLWLLPLSEAMALHAVVQVSSNLSRGALWIRYVRWRAAVTFLGGSAMAFAVWMLWRYIPDKSVAFILLGLSPFVVRLMPRGFKPDPHRLSHGLCYGAASMTLMLLAGVSGPLIDTFFLGGNFDRREIVATKAACQVVGHTAKFAYFGSVVAQASSVDPLVGGLAIAATMTGTALASPILERLSDTQYRNWANQIISVVAVTYLALGGYLLVT